MDRGSGTSSVDEHPLPQTASPHTLYRRRRGPDLRRGSNIRHRYSLLSESLTDDGLELPGNLLQSKGAYHSPAAAADERHELHMGSTLYISAQAQLLAFGKPPFGGDQSSLGIGKAGPRPFGIRGEKRCLVRGLLSMRDVYFSYTYSRKAA